MDYYSFVRIIKEYAHFPQWLPLPCHYEHGWNAWEGPIKSDLTISKNLMLVFSKRCARAWQKESDIPVVIIGSLFIHFRRMYSIEKSPDAKGTIAFPDHSTSVYRNNI